VQEVELVVRVVLVGEEGLLVLLAHLAVKAVKAQ
jgi:hypothetical protein